MRTVIHLLVYGSRPLIESAVRPADGGWRNVPVEFSSPLTLDRWTHVAIDLHLTGESPRYEVSLDGRIVASAKTVSGFAPGALSIRAGLVFTDGVNGFELLVDNVTLDYSP